MKHRIHLALAVSVAAAAGTAPSAVSANPGVLHKHGARAVGVPAMLPGQSMAGGAAPIAAGAAATTSSIAVAGFAPGSDAAVVIGGGVDGPAVIVADGLPDGGPFAVGGPAVDPGRLPICVMPAPDGHAPGPHGGPNVFHKLNPGAIAGAPGTIDGGIVDSGMMMGDGPPGGFAWGVVDRGPVDGAGDLPMVQHASFPPPGSGDGAGFAHHPTSTAMASAARASTSDGAGVGGRTLAGGLPNRAAGLRTDSVATPRHRGHGTASTPAGIAVRGDDARGSVVQAGGAADVANDPPRDDRSSNVMASAAAVQAAVPPAATATPRWRDRLRFAWPTRP